MDHSIVPGLILHSDVFRTGLLTSCVDVRLNIAKVRTCASSPLPGVVDFFVCFRQIAQLMFPKVMAANLYAGDTIKTWI